ncbi:sn-glycerol-3-phosphate ABC transporter ATP-binding protein UgpC [Rheinheimera sediminis]|uniref:ABC transporter ATP-binding protein n=1 Tax=Rheinheimera sp. YQF-1 TaxID=2499626 RepID=UPI000FDCA07A|nr:sn-glycerol-3-phosphate ABC transporter ATP-binding protein UgpC [Rheinheimera sp. YQF-1]RVT47099.1 sn-glycerol-3-phosphate ABC transporter ATP-binding protein UgpC [Rheinheimera sp. YQF-1]
MSQIELINIKKNYMGTEVVKGIDVTINEGEFAVIVGPSGCGKSTLLRMIAGLEDISSGELKIGGKLMNNVSPDQREIAMVFQSYALYPHMTVAENIGFALALKKTDKAEINRRVLEAAKMLELEHLLERKPAALSGGQRQRVAIGRAIVKRPKVILFDEPLSNLDAKLRVQMRTELMRLHREFGSTIVYVTHDQVEAMTMAQKIIVLNNGHVAQMGKPMDLYRDPENTFVAQFIGVPKMNLLRGNLQADVFTLQSGQKLQLDCGYRDGSDLQLGVRPEHLKLELLQPGSGSENNSEHSWTVDVVERLGVESFIHLCNAARDVLVLRLEGDCDLQVDSKVAVRFDCSHCYLFNEAGVRLLPNTAALDLVG